MDGVVAGFGAGDDDARAVAERVGDAGGVMAGAEQRALVRSMAGNTPVTK
ncbi:hypothetical protein [Streptomyces sp. NBC_01669]|nr:hypothetical protein [Streptomyces sp. NBC_01669]